MNSMNTVFENGGFSLVFAITNPQAQERYLFGRPCPVETISCVTTANDQYYGTTPHPSHGKRNSCIE